jgi:hypothetical protein
MWPQLSLTASTRRPNSSHKLPSRNNVYFLWENKPMLVRMALWR